LTTANELAARRGSQVFSNNDLIFQIRHDTARVARLQTVLAWKRFRGKAKDAGDQGADEDLAAVEEDGLDGPSRDTADDSVAKKIKLQTQALPWDVPSFFSQVPPEVGDERELLDEGTEAELERLRWADVKTSKMTVEEYTTWSEYRHASFTRRKVKRFRQWSGLGVIAEHRATDDVLDILSFLTFEMVQRLTERALAIQDQEMHGMESIEREAVIQGNGSESGGLFAPPPESPRSPLEPKHIRQAFEKLQTPPKRSLVMLNGTKLPYKGSLRLVSCTRCGLDYGRTVANAVSP
jgi:transcription initiation protein SPT3